MARADKTAGPLYRVWIPDHGETEESAADDGRRDFGAIDAGTAAEYFASICHTKHDGWEWTWPKTFRVKNLSTGKVFDVEVERHTVPEFEAGKPKEITDA